MRHLLCLLFLVLALPARAADRTLAVLPLLLVVVGITLYVRRRGAATGG